MGQSQEDQTEEGLFRADMCRSERAREREREGETQLVQVGTVQIDNWVYS